MNNKKPCVLSLFSLLAGEAALASERLKRREVKSVNMWDLYLDFDR